MSEPESPPIEAHVVETLTFNNVVIETFALESPPENDHDTNSFRILTEANRLFGLAKDHAIYTKVSIVDPITWLMNHGAMCGVWKEYLCELRNMRNKDVVKIIQCDSFALYMDFMYNNYADDFSEYDMISASCKLDTAYTSVIRNLRNRPREIISCGMYGIR